MAEIECTKALPRQRAVGLSPRRGESREHLEAVLCTKTKMWLNAWWIVARSCKGEEGLSHPFNFRLPHGSFFVVPPANAMTDEADADVGVHITADTAAALDDVASRFLLNLPESEASRVDRLFFQLQQAHWFYEDYYVDDEQLHIPHLSWEPFTKLMFHRCPLLVHIRQMHKDFFASFRSYVKRIPTFGVVLLDGSLEWVLLVQSYRGNSWGFPKGKAHEGESALDCAIREGYEETGYDSRKNIRYGRTRRAPRVPAAVGTPHASTCSRCFCQPLLVRVAHRWGVPRAAVGFPCVAELAHQVHRLH